MAFLLYFLLFFSALSYKIDNRRNHIEALTNQPANRQIENVMYYPGRRRASYLAISYSLGISIPHKHAHNNECYARKRHKEYLPRRVIKHHRENKASGISNFNYYKFPDLSCVLEEQKSAQKIAQIEKCTAKGTYKYKIQKEHKASRSLHKKEQAVLFALE